MKIIPQILDNRYTDVVSLSVSEVLKYPALM